MTNLVLAKLTKLSIGEMYTTIWDAPVRQLKLKSRWTRDQVENIGSIFVIMTTVTPVAHSLLDWDLFSLLSFSHFGNSKHQT